MPMIYIPGLNALIREFVIVLLANANASLDTRVLLARELSVLTTVMTVEHAGLKSIWHPKLPVFTQLLGTL